MGSPKCCRESNYSGTHPNTSNRMQGKLSQVKGYSRTHMAVTGVDSRFSTTVSLSAFPGNVWLEK